MSDLISKSALIEHMKDLPTWWADAGGCYPGSMKYPEGMYYPEDVISSIENAPTIEAVPVVWGYNNNQNYYETDEFRCSVCGLHLEDWSRRTFDEDTGDEFFVEYVFKYCPECGAKMKGGAE